MKLSHSSHSPWKSTQYVDSRITHRTTTTTHYDDRTALQNQRRYRFAQTPIGGDAVQGPLSIAGREDYVDPYPEPMRPGMTMGDLAQFCNRERHLGAQLTVIKMNGWHRRDPPETSRTHLLE
jgi:hypothetical protein